MIENLKSSLLAVFLLIVGWFLGLITTKFTFKQTRELEKRKILREKIEELAKLVYKLEDEYKQISTRIVTNAETGKEINLEDLISTNTLPPFPLISILIDFYFPELKTEYNELINKKEEFGKKVITFLKEKDKTNRKRIAGEIFLSELDEIDKICEKIISSSGKIAQRLL